MNLSTLDKLGYEGTDQDLATSLFEYGLAWKEYKRDLPKKGIRKGELHVYKGTQIDSSSNYIGFSCGFINRDDLINQSWIDYNAVADYIGMTTLELLNDSTGQLLNSLLSYYGASEFGLDDDNFQIGVRN